MQEKGITSVGLRFAYVQDTTSKGLQLVVKTENATLTPGEPILLTVVARNEGARPLFIVDTYHPEWDTKFDVRAEAGDRVALTEDGERLTKNIAIFRDVSAARPLNSFVKTGSGQWRKKATYGMRFSEACHVTIGDAAAHPCLWCTL